MTFTFIEQARVEKVTKFSYKGVPDYALRILIRDSSQHIELDVAPMVLATPHHTTPTRHTNGGWFPPPPSPGDKEADPSAVPANGQADEEPQVQGPKASQAVVLCGQEVPPL